MPYRSVMTDDPDFEAWMRGVPPDITTDTIWRMSAYRLALFLAFCSQKDLRWILNHRESRAYADQLLRAVGSISANIDEGYSRSSGRERAHFYEYALGSAREARGWYYKCSAALPEDVLLARLAQLSRIIRILTAIVPRERAANSIWRKRSTPPELQPPPDNPAATSSS